MKKNTVKTTKATETQSQTVAMLPDLAAPANGIKIRSRVRAGALPCGDGETC